MVDERDGARDHGLVIDGVEAVEVDLADVARRRIVDDRQEVGQHELADLALERAAFLLVVLPLALEAMPDGLVKEDAGRALHE